jgi:hypothetical protein
MPFTVPATNIMMSDINQGLTYPFTGSPLNLVMSNLYAYSDVDGLTSTYAGSYHNTLIGVSTGTFAQNIYVNYAASDNMKIGNWANYSHSENVNITYTFNNTLNPFRGDVNVDVWLSDAFGAPLGGPIDSFMVYDAATPGFQTVTQTNFNSGIDAYTTFSGIGGYYIYLRMQTNAIPNQPVNVQVSALSDTDGVGPNLGRTDWITANSAWDLNNVTGQGMFVNTMFCGATPFGNVIAWNKRTRFIIDFI